MSKIILYIRSWKVDLNEKIMKKEIKILKLKKKDVIIKHDFSN